MWFDSTKHVQRVNLVFNYGGAHVPGLKKERNVKDQELYPAKLNDHEQERQNDFPGTGPTLAFTEKTPAKHSSPLLRQTGEDDVLVEV